MYLASVIARKVEFKAMATAFGKYDFIVPLMKNR